jgi:uncharacterized LabA/DUF88 family protein
VNESTGEISPTIRLAILIDAENASHRDVPHLLVEASRYGIATVKRAYGDWTRVNLSGWREILLEHAIRPMQQFAHTSGKNASDSALIIDAMDLLHARQLDGFCIVSSDGDFTGLVNRLRESGLLVLGFGEQKTPRALVTACDRFIYTELLRPDLTETPFTVKRNPERDADLIKLLREAIAATSDDTGWAALSAIGANIRKQRPDFDAHSWGFNKLSDLVKAMPRILCVEARSRGGAPDKHFFVRDAQRP